MRFKVRRQLLQTVNVTNPANIRLARRFSKQTARNNRRSSKEIKEIAQALKKKGLQDRLALWSTLKPNLVMAGTCYWSHGPNPNSVQSINSGSEEVPSCQAESPAPGRHRRRGGRDVGFVAGERLPKQAHPRFWQLRTED